MNSSVFLKLAIDKARRLFGLGLLGKAVGSVPSLASKAGGSINRAAGLGATDAVPVQALKATKKLDQNLSAIAEARLYRMNRVAGDSRGKALAKLQFAKKKREIELKLARPKRMLDTANNLPKLKEGFETNLDGLAALGSSARNINTGSKAAFGLALGRVNTGI